MSTVRRTQRCLPLVLCAATVCLLWSLGPSVAYTSALNGALSKKQSHGQLHNKNYLPRHPQDILAEESVRHPSPKAPMRKKQVPYTINIDAHHDSRARKYIQTKLTAALHNFKDGIRHVEVHLLVSEHFHQGAHVEVVDKGKEAKSARENAGRRILTPYILKAAVSLKNHRAVILSNPEKYAQATLVEAVDHICDVLRHRLREVKDKAQALRRKASRMLQFDDENDPEEIAMEELEELAAERDAQDEAMYAELAAVDAKM